MARVVEAAHPSKAIPRLPWSLLSVDPSRTHLLVASMPSAQAVGGPTSGSPKTRFCASSGPKNLAGDYATAILRQEGPAQVAFAFEKEGTRGSSPPPSRPK